MLETVMTRTRHLVSLVSLSLVGFAALAACDGDDDFVEAGDDDVTEDAGTSSSGSSSGRPAPDAGRDAEAPLHDAGSDARPDGSDAAPDSGVATVEIYIDAFCPFSCSEFEVGASQILSARVLAADGSELSGVPVVWESADPAIATVDQAGKAIGVAAGTVQARGVAGGVTGTIELSILPSPITRVEIAPADTQLAAIGDSATFSAKAYNRLDQLVPDATFEWFVSDPNLGTIDQGGVFTGTAQGLGIVQAASGTAAGWAKVTVVGPIATRPATAFDQLSGGAHHGCGVQAGVAYCWGYNYFGQLGNGEAGSVDGIGSPQRVLGGLTFTSIAAGESHTCGIVTGGAAYCWGGGGAGQLGNGDPEVRGSMTPIPVVGGHSFVQLASGGFHTCGLDDHGALYCWGWDGGGSVGTGVDTNYWSPQAITPGTRYLDLVAGLDHTCALQEDHLVKCWGTNTSSAVGNGAPDGTVVPLPTALPGNHHFTSIDSYGTHTCGIEQDGSIWCWGRNDTGQAGNGQSIDASVPVQLDSTETFVQVTTGAHHTCARTQAGATLCTGDGQYGQLGTGMLDFSVRVVPVIGGLTFVDIEAGSHFTCGRLASKATYCWGASSTGQLGGGYAGPAILSTVPSPVAALAD